MGATTRGKESGGIGKKRAQEFGADGSRCEKMDGGKFEEDQKV